MHVDPRTSGSAQAPRQAKTQLRRIELDTLVGHGLLQRRRALHYPHDGRDPARARHHGHRDLAQAAEALRPIAGQFAFMVFAMGIVGTGLLAVPVLAGSGAYALGEALRWPTGFSRRWREAKAFYATVTLATLIGMGMNFAGVNPIGALYWSAVLNGIVAVPLMVTMMLMAARTDIMGRFAIAGWLRGLGWAATVVMGLTVAGLFASVFLG